MCIDDFTTLLCRVTKGKTVHRIDLEARTNKSDQIKFKKS